ncbi:hypothetical protein [Actinomadura miaoliensis]|uniref:DUF4333 domain-containing protein n=1 Tax=Actinomadura miaoliensis TaxID=430685 RepID=A0ABP7VGK9_9ACTN
MDLRQRGVLGGAVVILLGCTLAAGCGGERKVRLATTPLPLQPSGLAVGGDVQAHSSNVAQARLSEDQVRQIADACRAATDLPQVGSDCSEKIKEAFRRSGKTPCRAKRDPCLVAKVAPGAPTTAPGAQVVKYFEITDPRPPGESLCGPTQVCLRVGASSSEVFNKIVGTAGRPAGPSETGGPSVSPSATVSSPPGQQTTVPAPAPSETGSTAPQTPEPGPPQPPQPGPSGSP